jgi:transposase
MTLEEAIAAIAELREENLLLKAKVAELEARLKKDSSTSSKPPSSDIYRKPASKDRSLRERSGKKPGGQPGHPGATLQMSANPTTVTVHTPFVCAHCGGGLEGGTVISKTRRQVFDIPQPQPLAVDEHISFEIECPHCRKSTVGDFPAGVDAPVQYGPRIKALTVDIAQGNMVAIKRCAALVESITGAHISTGTVMRFILECADGLEPWRKSAIGMVLKSVIAHFDETGIRCLGKLHWLHSASTSLLTVLHINERRGKEGSDAGGILPFFTGVATHDCWKAYFRYLLCRHNPCRAHFLRELEALVKLRRGQTWASGMKKLLLEMKGARDKAEAKGKALVAPVDILLFGGRYDALLDLAFAENPDKTGGKGCADAFNLATRLKELREEVLSFLWDVSIPFTNNQAERDIRMVKVKSKVSGCFRSVEGAQAFATIRSYISTAAKNGVDVLQALAQAFAGKPFLPQMQV